MTAVRAFRRHCERSEAIQPRAGRRAEKSKLGSLGSPHRFSLTRSRAQLDCFVASLLAMTADVARREHDRPVLRSMMSLDFSAR